MVLGVLLERLPDRPAPEVHVQVVQGRLCGEDHAGVLGRLDDVVEQRVPGAAALFYPAARAGGDAVVGRVADRHRDLLIALDAAGRLGSLRQHPCVAEEPRGHARRRVLQGVGQVHADLLGLEGMPLGLRQALADAQVRHRVRPGQQLEGQQVLGEVHGHLLRTGIAALLARHGFRPVDDRQRVGAGPGGRVQGDHGGSAEAEVLPEPLSQQGVHHADLALHHADRRVVDAGTAARLGVVALEEVLVEPQPRLAARVRGPLDRRDVHACDQAGDGPDLGGDVLHQRGDAENRAQRGGEHVAVRGLQRVLRLLQGDDAVRVAVGLPRKPGDRHRVGHHLGDVPRELLGRSRVLHGVVPRGLRLHHGVVRMLQPLREPLSQEAGQRGQAVRELAHPSDGPRLRQRELLQHPPQPVRIPAGGAVDRERARFDGGPGHVQRQELSVGDEQGVELGQEGPLRLLAPTPPFADHRVARRLELDPPAGASVQGRREIRPDAVQLGFPKEVEPAQFDLLGEAAEEGREGHGQLRFRLSRHPHRERLPDAPAVLLGQRVHGVTIHGVSLLRSGVFAVTLGSGPAREGARHSQHVRGTPYHGSER